MKERLKKAAEEGILLGVKYGIVLAILAFVAQDYMHARSNALYGKAAQEWILAGIQAGKLPADWRPAAPLPSPAAVTTPVDHPVSGPLPVPLASPAKAK